ncbi:MAG: hypothetical protein ABL997_17280 [Planctomycetota bacterium]
MLHLLASLSLFVCAPQEPIRIGAIAVDNETSSDVHFVRGARRAIDSKNQKGGVDGQKLELVIAAADSPAGVAAAMAQLQQAGVAAVLAPVDPWLQEPVRKACAGKLPCVSFAVPATAQLAWIDRLVQQKFCMTRIGFVHDQKAKKDLGKLLDKNGLSAPGQVLCELDVATNKKALQKAFEKDRPELLLIDAEPAATALFLQTLADDPIPVVLTSRAFGEPVRKLSRRVFVVNGLSCACASTTSQFRSDYEKDYGVPGIGAVEGHEGVLALADAFDLADSREPLAVRTALARVVLEGVRGRYEWDKALDAFAAPHGAWIVEGPVSRPYAPAAVALGTVGSSSGTGERAERTPQAQVGEPFGTWRTRQFVPEENAQWVLCEWATDDGHRTSSDDLVQLGLSTGGADPIVDHIVREEIMARVMAIASTKFLRKEDGSGVVGTSLRIAFAMHVSEQERAKKKQRAWPALFGGDDEGAGGRAFGSYCRVYSTFIRRTIFQKHALVPAVTTDDLQFLDGSYVFGTDLKLDKRSELIRALINGYAGSMALTLAHEVGHLCGLDHVEDDPVEIMNVNEGAGLDYRDANFGAPSIAHLKEHFGVTGDKPGKKN